MGKALPYAIASFAIPGVVVFALSAALMWFYSFRMVQHRKPAVSVWSWWLFGDPQVSLLVCPELLTEQGLYYRARALMALAVCAGVFALFLVSVWLERFCR